MIVTIYKHHLIEESAKKLENFRSRNYQGRSESEVPPSAIPNFDFEIPAMSSSSSHPAKNEDLYIRQSKGAPVQFLIPLIYAPVLPLIRIALRHKPVLRDRLFIGVLAGAVAHGSYLVANLYDSESK